MLTDLAASRLPDVTARPRVRFEVDSAWPDPQRQLRATYTVEDLITLPDDTPRYELRDGVVITVPAPTLGHQRVVGKLWRLLEDTVTDAYTVASAVGIMINQHNTLEPDVVVLRGHVESTLHYFPPNQCLVAVEVVSPSTKRRDRDEKPGLYASAGVPHYWRIEQDPLEVYVYDLADGAYVLVADTTVTGELRIDTPFELRLGLHSL